MTRYARHLVLATIGSLGDLHPMMALGRALQRRGHRVTVASTAAHGDRVTGAGLPFHALRPDLSPEDTDLVRRVMDQKRGPEVLIRRVLMPHLQDTFDDLDAIAADADALVAGEIVFPAPLVAERRGLPWAPAILSPLSFFSVHDPPVVPALPVTRHLHAAPVWLHRAMLTLGRRSVRGWTRPVSDLRHRLGLPERGEPLFRGKFSPWLNLALFSRLLGAPQPDWPAHTVQPGFVFYDRMRQDADLPPALADFLAAGEAPIVFTLGSAAVLNAGSFFEESVAAARRLGRRALLLMGDNPVPEDLPASIAAFDYAPYSHVFPHAACVVHQGGAGTTAQALRAGVPQLVVPFGFDQPDNATRLVRRGVARTVARRAYTAARAERALARLLGDPGYAQAARAAAEALEDDGADAACDALEARLLGSAGAAFPGAAP